MSVQNETFISNLTQIMPNFDFENTSCFDKFSSQCHKSNLNLTSSFDNLSYFKINEKSEKIYWALFLIFLPFLAVFGNTLVILSVYKEKSLHSATNYFIASLAVADLLVAAIVMPFGIYYLVNVDWELGELLCDFYIAMDVNCSTASILNLVAISIDRFIAVTKPIKYAKHKSNTRVSITIAIVWIVSATIATPIVLGLNTTPERRPDACIFYNSDFIIYSSLGSFYIPCVLMVFLYYKIFNAIHDRAKRTIGASKKQQKHESKHSLKLSKGNQPSEANQQTLTGTQSNQKVLIFHKFFKIKHKKILNKTNETKELVLGSKSVKTEDSIQFEIKQSVKIVPPNHVLDNSEDFSTNNQTEIIQLKQDNISQQGSSEESFNRRNETSKKGESPSIINGNNLQEYRIISPEQSAETNSSLNKGKKLSRFNLGRKHKSSQKKREKASVKKERKATKTLAIVLGVFLICWLPFFTCNIIDAICIKLQSDDCKPGIKVYLFTTWLGYVNSCLNPVIYTIFNTEFRKAFKKIIAQFFSIKC